ncbi:MAG: hypothetical protein HYS26_04630 [Candidatus Kaiserbacteria bacterium]|nr:MAG: hypothetical protein HYS26_04630 [Candidatus Kaiserbacteria bacterium]
MPAFLELFGWYGTVAIIGAYALVSFSVLQPSDLVYQLLNGTGAFGILAISYYKRTYQPAVLNAIWAIIAIVAVIGILT